MEKEMNKVFVGGIDIGNKNYKVSIDDIKFEFPIAYSEISEYSFNNEEVGSGTKKVKYKGKFYLVGLNCNRILPKNKGHKSFRDEANMIKLVGLSLFLEKKNETKGEFKLVIGTPLNDFDEYEDDYKDLMLEKEEEIIVDGITYNIVVSDTFVSKQCAAVAPTINGWKEKEHLILIDLGGGTADIAYFRNGNKVRYITAEFPLNKIVEDLGNYLNGLGLGLIRPDESNSGYLHTIERVIKEGNYLNVSSLEIDGVNVSLSQIINNWLQPKADGLIENIALRLDLSDVVKNASDVYYFAGGSLLLRKELSENKTFKNKTIINDPEYANVKAFDIISKIRKW